MGSGFKNIKKLFVNGQDPNILNRITTLENLLPKSYVNNTLFSCTSSATDEVAQTILIPASTCLGLGEIEVFSTVGGTSNANTKTFKIWINTSADLSGSPVLIGQAVFTTNATASILTRRITILTNTTAVVSFPTSVSSPSWIASSITARSSITIPTLASNTYIVISANRINAGDTVQVSNTIVKINNA